MPDIDLSKILLGNEQEKQIKDLLNNLLVLVASAQEVIANVNKSVEDINEITSSLRGMFNAAANKETR